MKKLLPWLAWLAAATLSAAAPAPVILNINYICSDSTIHIGSQITVFMSTVIPSQALSLSLQSSSSSQMTLSGTALASLAAQDLYVTDGVRAWVVPFAGAGASQLSFGDAQLLSNAAPFSGVDYDSLSGTVFRAYAGSLVTGISGGSPSLSVDLGAFATLLLFDQGMLGDAVAADGVWTGVYTVPELGYSIANGKFFGQCVVGGMLASNAPFQSQAAFNIDGVSPVINSKSFSTNKILYGGALYLSSLSQGNSVAQPTNATERFDMAVNKQNCSVDIDILCAAPMHLPTLNPGISLNGHVNWDGTDGNGIFLPDGVYDVNFYIKDSNGVTGLTQTGQVKVVSAKIDFSGLSLSPASIAASAVTGTVTAVNYTIKISNDSGSSLASSLQVLGWQGVSAYGQPDHLYSNVFALMHADLLNSLGGTALSSANDGQPQDQDFLVAYRTDPAFLLPACYAGLAPGAAGTSGNQSLAVNIADQDPGNDWNSLQPLQIQAGSVSAPTQLGASATIQMNGAMAVQGSYTLRLQAQLSGMDASASAAPGAPNYPDPCAPGPDVWKAKFTHFYPSAQPEGPSDGRGLISNEDFSLSFDVLPPPTPTPTFTQSATFSATETATPTASPSLTLSPSSTPSVTCTFSSSPTATQSATPGYRLSALGHSALGPVPAHSNEPLCLYYESQPASSTWDAYNSAGERIAHLGFGPEYASCWDHRGVASGLYLISLDIQYMDGRRKTSIQKAVILN